MKDLTEKTIATRKIFSGRVVDLQVDQVQLPDGSLSEREIVKHPGAVAIMAVTPEEKLVLVRQFRKPLEKTILEIPAGKLNPDENPKLCAQRELEEETGYRAGRIHEVYSFYTSPGFADELIRLYWAEDLQKGKVKLDQDEFVELVELTLDECMEKLKEGEICDAKTIVALHYLQSRMRKEK